jgi:uncharacterized membrane protein YeaQ/YmgE (transglycosylase-associated protein family)
MPSFIAVIIIGAIVGLVARFLYPGPNTMHGFILTTVLGIGGAALATFSYRSFGWIEPNRLADFISMAVASTIVLFAWNRLAAYDVVSDPGMHHDRKEASTKKSDTPTAD